ncbi:MAG: glycosyltransferase family 1 protein [Smithellaceae bacterium]
MRIAIDMQGAQTPFSRHRGVGRYTMGLVKALLRDPRDHEIYLALNGAFQDAIDAIRGEFEGLLPQENMRVWQQFYDCSAINPGLAPRKWAAEVSREAFLNNLNPEIIFSTNLQEGWYDPAPTSVKVLPSRSLFCTTLHDVIPLVYPERYLAAQAIRNWYNEKIEGVRKSDIILTDSEHSKKEIVDLVGVPSDRVTAIYAAVDSLKFKQRDISSDKRDALLACLGISSPFLLYSGGGDVHKNLHRLYQAFARLPLELRKSHQLVIVGKDLHREQDIHRKILKKLGINARVIFTGYVDDDYLISLYNLCKLFVFPSLHEGFGLPPLEAMACGAPVIASQAGSLPEVVGLNEALFDPCDEIDIARKMERALSDFEFREQLRLNGIARVASFSWDNSAGKLLDLFDMVGDKLKKNNVSVVNESLAISSAGAISESVPAVIEGIMTRPIAVQLKPREMMAIAISLAETYSTETGRSRKLFLDVSAVIKTRVYTGIQRVARAICYELVRECKKIEVVPIYTNVDEHEFYRAGLLIDHILGNLAGTTENSHIEFCSGDILLYLDHHPSVAISNIDKTRYLRNKGIAVYHVVYDLLPVQYPQYFWPGLCDEFVTWLKAVSYADGALCISRTVAIELRQWLDTNIPRRRRPLKIGWFHLGADFENSIPSLGIPADGYDTIGKLASGASFLVVGTIEPRKGHVQTLAAFEQLWAAGVDVNLVIVGKKGWGSKNFVNKLLSHPQRGSRLHWIEGISDEYLEKIYASCICLIAASEEEGFGLPLIEAAQHKISIIARDIPVFREVAGDHVFYFKGREPQALTEAVRQWLELYSQGKAPQSDNMPRLTWKQSAEQLIKVVLGLSQRDRPQFLDQHVN